MNALEKTQRNVENPVAHASYQCAMMKVLKRPHAELQKLQRMLVFVAVAVGVDEVVAVVAAVVPAVAAVVVAVVVAAMRAFALDVPDVQILGHYVVAAVAALLLLLHFSKLNCF